MLKVGKLGTQNELWIDVVKIGGVGNDLTAASCQSLQQSEKRINKLQFVGGNHGAM